MADELSTRDVESVLGQMQLEVKQKLDQLKILKHIEGVIAVYKKATTELAAMASAKAELQKAHDSLQERHDYTLAGHAREAADSRAAADKEVASNKARLEASRKQMADLDAQVKEKELFAQRRMAQLEKDTKDREQALERAQASLDSFMDKHGLARKEA